MGDTTATTTIDRSITSRMMGAAKLQDATYEDVEHDESATAQAATVVVVTSVLAGIGTGFQGGVVGITVGIVGALIAWAVYAWIAYFLGTTILKGAATQATWGQVARGLGFAQAPRALLVLAFIPALAAILGLIVAIWVIATTVVALRAALDFSTMRALGTALLAAIAQAVVFGIVAAVAGTLI